MAGLALSKSSTDTLFFSAIWLSVSPLTTVYSVPLPAAPI